MNEIQLPQPKYELNRYTSRQLLAWIEECELSRCHAWSNYINSAGNDAGMWLLVAVDSAMRADDIMEVLTHRGLEEVAQRAVSDTNRDYNS